MVTQEQTSEYASTRQKANLAQARSFLMLDPCRPPATLDRSACADIVVIDADTCAERDGATATLSSTLALIGAVRRDLPSGIWLRLRPAGANSRGLIGLAGLVEGLALPGVRTVADVEAVARILGDTHPVLVMPVFQETIGRAEVDRVAAHPLVARLAAARPQARSNLPQASQAQGLPWPVNGMTPDPIDACELMHDAVVALCEGFGGQCVPVPSAVVDVERLYRDPQR
ncbi:hypothetical protein ACFRAO_23655 [Streptomyces sp. NPDC056656]|uniref:hypothetical protein n=1 Tax=Streptomyces sp. NPDC056656 TaxID=3345895 RepID=UPI003674F0AB